MNSWTLTGQEGGNKFSEWSKSIFIVAFEVFHTMTVDLKQKPEVIERDTPWICNSDSNLGLGTSIWTLYELDHLLSLKLINSFFDNISLSLLLRLSLIIRGFHA